MEDARNTRLWMLRSITLICCLVPPLSLGIELIAGYPLLETRWYVMLTLPATAGLAWFWYWRRWPLAMWFELLIYFALVTQGMLMSAGGALSLTFSAGLTAHFFLPFVGVFYREWRLCAGGGVLGLAGIWFWLLMGSGGSSLDAWRALYGASVLFVANALLQCLVARLLARRERQLLAAMARAEEQERLYRLLADNAADVVALHDAGGAYVFVSPASLPVLGYGPAELLGRHPWDLAHPDEQAVVRSAYLAARAGRPAQASFRFQKKNGDYVWLEMLVQPIPGTAGVPDQMQSSSRDITERKAVEAQLEHQAFHDPLTRLPNRTLFEDRVRHALSRRFRPGVCPAVLFLDLDNFKRINDNLGHRAGDEVLAAVADRLRQCLRPADTLARLGGDEFAILLDEVAAEADAVAVAERILAQLDAPIAVAGREVDVRASIGVVPVWDLATLPEQLLRNADVAMYQAKHMGKARYMVFDPRLAERVFQRMELESDLRRAVERGELRLHYQPIVALEHGRIAGFEALVRWQHPTRGLLLPAEFIPLAEETDLILEVGWWVLESACGQIRDWQRQYPQDPPLFVGVNLSARQFRAPHLAEQIAAILERTGVEPSQLHLEVPEAVLMQDRAVTAATLEKLRSLGVQFSVDDFGTGYAAIGHLAHFPVNSLKLDRAFVQQAGEDAPMTAVVESMLSLARSLQMRVTGEGFETAEQFRLLRGHAVDRGQGYFFARPLTAGAAAELLASNACFGEPPPEPAAPGG